MELKPQTIDPLNTTSMEYVDIPTEVATEVFYGPKEVKADIRSGFQTTSFYITLASKVSTRVKIGVSDPSLVMTREDTDGYLIYKGAQQTINFVAFAPHSGTITIRNEVDEILATIPYTVNEESTIRQSISGNVSTGGSISSSYTLSSNDGWSMSVGVQYDPVRDSLSGSLGGSYSW